MNKLYPFLLSITLTALSLASCKKDADVVAPGTEPPGPSAPVGAVTPVAAPDGAIITATIGPAGGTIESADKRLRVSVPAGALTANQTLSVQPLTKNNCPQGTGMAFRLLPHGLTFAKPATLTIQYNEQDINGSAPQLLRIAYQTDKGHWQSPATKGIDTTARTVTVQTTHFSDWGLFQQMVITPDQAFVNLSEEVELKVLEVPLKDYGEELLVAIPSYLSTQYIEKWTLRGAGTLAHQHNKGNYYAPATIPATNPAAITVFLNKSTTINGQLFKDLRLVSNIYVMPEGITFRINGGKWVHTLAAARVIGQQGRGYLNMVGGTAADEARWGVSVLSHQIPPETEGNLATNAAGMVMPWLVDPTSPAFYLSDQKEDMSYQHYYPVGRVFHPSPGALTFYRFGKVGTYVIGKFELQKAGMYSDTKGYLGTARIEGFFRMKREV